MVMQIYKNIEKFRNNLKKFRIGIEAWITGSTDASRHSVRAAARTLEKDFDSLFPADQEPKINTAPIRDRMELIDLE